MKYTCAMCKKSFESDWTDEEARNELNDKFENVQVSDCEIVCDDCYNKVMSTINN